MRSNSNGRHHRAGALACGVAAAALVALGACTNKSNEREATNALGRDSSGSTTTGTGVNGSGGLTGYAPPGQGGAMSDTMHPAAAGATPAGAPSGPTASPSAAARAASTTPGARPAAGTTTSAGGGTRRP